MYDCWLYSVPCFWYVCSVYVCLCCVLCKRGTDNGVVLSLLFTRQLFTPRSSTSLGLASHVARR